MCSQSILQRPSEPGGESSANDPCARPAGSASTTGIERLLSVASHAFDMVAADPDMQKTASLAPILALGRSALREAGTLLRAAAAPGLDDAPAAIDVRELLRRIGPLLENVVRQDGRFSIDLCRHLPLVRCDAVALEVTILSLIVHARKELRPGGDLRLKAARHIDPNSQTGACIEVSAALNPCRTGPARAHDRIGLATAARLAESIGGRIELKRSTGTMAITLWLPGRRPSPSLSTAAAERAWACAPGRGAPMPPDWIGPRDVTFANQENDPCPKKP